ncbi:MAG: hypothetical protein GWN62_02330 [Aliifodinibius sp.]|nr:hypothetical protein [Fodinibius sp.]
MSDFYGATALTGGGTGALDAIDGNDVADGDGAIVIDATNDKVYFYTLNASSAAAESSPNIISPDSNAGDKRWILTDAYGYDGTNTHYLSNKPDRVAAPVANNLVGMDASGDLIDTSIAKSSVAQFTANQAWTKNQRAALTDLTSSISTSAITPVWASHAAVQLSLTGSLTINNPTGAADGYQMLIKTIQDASGANAITWSASISFGGHDSSVSTSGSAVTWFMLWTDGTNTFGRRFWKTN